MKRGLQLMAVLLLMPSAFAVEKRVLKSVFCIQEVDGWRMQSFPPLINPKQGTTYAELWVDGNKPERVMLHRYLSNRQVSFEYHYDSTGELKTLEAAIELWGNWVAEADLPAHGDTSKVPQQVHYYSERKFQDASRTTIGIPENARRYTADFTTAPRLLNASLVPCVDKLSVGVERVNATQK